MIINFFISQWIFVWAFLFYINIVSVPPLIETIYFTLFISTYLLYHYNIKRPIIYIISIFIHSLPLFFVKRYYEEKKNRNKVHFTLYINTIILVIYSIMMTYFKKDIITFYKTFTIFVKNNSLLNISKYLIKI